MRRLALAAVVAAAFAVPVSSAAPGFTYDRELASWAHASLELASIRSGSGRKRVPARTYVRCYADRVSFERPLLARGASQQEARGTIAYYDLKGSIHLRAGTCAAARRFAAGSITPETAGAFTTLLHESLHRQGFRDENATECWAIASVAHGATLAVWRRLGRATDAAWRRAVAHGERAVTLAYRASLATTWDEYLVSADCLDRAERESWADYLRTH